MRIWKYFLFLQQPNHAIKPNANSQMEARTLLYFSISIFCSWNVLLGTQVPRFLQISHHRPECCTASRTSRQNTKAREKNPGLDLPAVILCLVWTKQDKENGVGRSNSWTIFHLTCYFTVSSTPDKINVSLLQQVYIRAIVAPHPII